jgi:hypothetical protein
MSECIHLPVCVGIGCVVCVCLNGCVCVCACVFVSMYHDQNALNETIGYHSGYQDTHIVLVRLCKTVLGTLDPPKAMS